MIMLKGRSKEEGMELKLQIGRCGSRDDPAKETTTSQSLRVKPGRGNQGLQVVRTCWRQPLNTILVSIT
jgi:hypothetical protein